jgi:hypothetical protein
MLVTFKPMTLVFHEIRNQACRNRRHVQLVAGGGAVVVRSVLTRFAGWL